MYTTAMNQSNNSRFPTWQWLAAVLLALVIGLTGLSFSSVKSDVSALEDAMQAQQQYWNSYQITLSGRLAILETELKAISSSINRLSAQTERIEEYQRSGR